MGLCLGYFWGIGQGIGDWHRHWQAGDFLGEVSDSSWETGLHAPRTSKHGPGSAVYTPWEQVRSALWGTPRPAKSQNLHLDDLSGFRAHLGTCTEAARPRLGPHQTTCPAQLSTCHASPTHGCTREVLRELHPLLG